MLTPLIEGATNDSTLREHIHRKLNAMLERLRVKPVSARIILADENGSKGGVDNRCTIIVELPRRPTLPVHVTAATPLQAFEAALEKLERQVERERGRLRETRRRPKKYFIAKRLLAPDVTTELSSGVASEIPGDKRPRRRRSA